MIKILTYLATKLITLLILPSIKYIAHITILKINELEIFHETILADQSIFCNPSIKIFGVLIDLVQ